MDGGNRRFLVASTLLAIPAALLMVSLSSGTVPGGGSEITHAVGNGDDDSGAVQQVIGKQIETRKTRPLGLLGALTGEKSTSRQPTPATPPRQAKPRNSEPRGLLDGLFDTTSESSRTTHSRSTHSRSTSSHRESAHAPAAPRQEPANWDGIPYHRVDGVSRSTTKTPIRDPSAPVTSTRSSEPVAGTRIIRGGSSRTIEAKPVSVRRQPTLAVSPAPSLVAPEAAVVRSGRDLSGNTSSRRSGRRSVDVLDASEIAAASKAPAPELSATADLVPKVTRREVEETPPSTDKAVTVAEAKTTPNETAKADAIPTLQPAPAQSPTALAVISSPSQENNDSKSEPAAEKGTANATLSAPTPTTPPAYTTPVDPQTQPVPVAGIPSHPYAALPAKTPSLPVAHRSGPPAAAFAPIKPQGQASQFNTASAPVGSGIAANGGVASFRQGGLNTPQTLPADPYAAAANQPNVYQPVPNRMSTNGQPVEPATDNRVAARPAHETATVPMHPIAGHGSAVAGPATAATAGQDNFAAPGYDTRNNQMRRGFAGTPAMPGVTAASSELPGIRVITNGPGEIMIRQTNQYEIRVENRGSIDAQGVLVRALIPDWAELRGQNATQGDIDTQTQGSSERLVWTIDHLPAGGSERMFVRLKAAQSGTYDLDVDWTLTPQKSVAKVHVHEPKLGLSIDGPDQVVFGQSQTYKVRVLNPGDGTAPNVVFTLSPNSATPQTQRIGDIPAGKEAQFEVELTAQDLGDLKIHGLASGDLELRAESSKTIRVAAAKLEAMLTGPQLKYQNTESMYNLQLQNTGAATSEKIIATLRLPVGVKYLGGIDEAELRGNLLRWEITSLAPGATRNYQFRCNMTTTGEHLFTFDCKGTAAGNSDVSIATRVESISDLVLSISDPVAPAPIGTDVTYEIVVRNRGSKEATDVLTVAQFSHGIEPLRIEGQSGEVVTGQVLFDTIPRIAPGQEVRMRVVAQADRAGHHRFRTEVRSGDTVLVAEEATHYMSPTSERVSRRSTDPESQQR